MLETLVPSKIRRALLEYILTHPTTRFYLRGLAKELGLSVSPLRRELKRVEELGLLKSYQEANILFYVVDQSCSQFAQLRTVLQAPSPKLQAQEESMKPGAWSVEPHVPVSEPLVASTVLSHANVERLRRVLTPAVSWPLLLGGIGLAGVVLVLGGMAWYLVASNQQLISLTQQAVVAPRSQVTVVESVGARPASQMQGSRWRLMPGTMGGFSAGTGEGSY